MLVNMAAQDEVDVCESWEDMDEIGVSLTVKVVSKCCLPRCPPGPSYFYNSLSVSVRPKDQADVK